MQQDREQSMGAAARFAAAARERSQQAAGSSGAEASESGAAAGGSADAEINLDDLDAEDEEERAPLEEAAIQLKAVPDAVFGLGAANSKSK